MKTIVASIVGVIAVWLRQSGIIDIDDETAGAIVVTVLLVVQVFQRLGTMKSEKAAVVAGQKAEDAASQAADQAADRVAKECLPK